MAGAEPGSPMYPQVRAARTREVFSLGLIHLSIPGLLQRDRAAAVSGGCAAAGPAGADEEVPWEGEHPRAAEESQGAQHSQGGSLGERDAAWEKLCELLPKGGDEERDQRIPLKRSVMPFFYKDSCASM